MWNNIEKFNVLFISAFMLLIIHEGACRELVKIRHRREPIPRSLRKITLVNFQDKSALSSEINLERLRRSAGAEDDITVAEKLASGRFKRDSTSVEEPPSGDPGKAFIEKAGKVAEETINKLLASLVSSLIGEMEKAGKKLMDDAAQFGNAFNRTLSAFAPGLLPPPGGPNLDPFGLFKLNLTLPGLNFNFTAPNFDFLKPQNAGQG